jgi:MFS family permease
MSIRSRTALSDSPAPPAPSPDAAARRWWRPALPSTFSSLRHRNYRLLWLGTLVSSSGDWMDQIALNWLVYQLTGSAVYLGVLNLCRLAPILVFTLIGGVIADRVERRRLMFTTQTIAMLLALLLAALVSTGVVQVWMVLLIAIGRGVMMSFNQPARQSLISELVPHGDLMNAIALNSATLNLTRVIGPAIGGVLIVWVGVAGAFYLNAASFLAVLYGLSRMRFSERTVKARRGVVHDLVEGVRYLNGQPALRTLVVLALVPMVLGMPYMTMLTVFAKDVLGVGGGGLGLLTASTGVGAVAGALFVASLSGSGRRGRLMFAGLILFGLALLVFATSPWLWLSLGALVAVGVSQQVYLATNNTLIQISTSEEYRGRISSTLFLNRGMVPLGTMLAGFGTSLFSAQVAVGTMAAALVLMAVLVARLAPAARELE